jgi:hypothetical protein
MSAIFMTNYGSFTPIRIAKEYILVITSKINHEWFFVFIVFSQIYIIIWHKDLISYEFFDVFESYLRSVVLFNLIGFMESWYAWIRAPQIHNICYIYTTYIES